MRIKRLLAAFAAAAMAVTAAAIPVLADGKIIVDASKTITLRGETITGTDGAGITVNSGASLDLILEDENSVTGAPGFAGIYVAPGATLTISGSGSLTATGGDGYSIDKNTRHDPKEGLVLRRRSRNRRKWRPACQEY